ncbi:hypothetical protein GF420_04545 [candidate division GN15 bacterium]|nr:hypothetical protein [candidate division GN15 bacterium]
MTDRDRRDSSQTELPLNHQPAPQPEQPAPKPVATGPSLEWVSHPVKRSPLVSLAVTVFIVACCIITYAVTESGWFAGLALAILFGTLAKFYFPTKYRMDDRGVTVKTMTQTLTKEWKLFRSFYPDKNGVLLSPFAEPSRLENFRGMYVMYEGNRDEVVSFVRRHIGEEDTEPPKGETP